MSNEITGVTAKEAAVDIKALFLGTGGSKSPAPEKGGKTRGAVANSGNTNKQPEDLDKEKQSVQEAVELFEKFARENQFDLKFSVDDKSNAIVVQLFEKGTGKLIRQIPSEEVLRLKQRISDLLGMIYDTKV
jgi:flagellar protein FlaG